MEASRMRSRCLFKRRDMTAAIRAAEAAGHAVERVEIDREGRIVVVLRQAGEVAATTKNEWDQ
jgi:hypothetical protein